MRRTSRIRVAMVHYHLRRGGVTRVIEHALAALPGDRVEVVVLAGEAPSAPGIPSSCTRVVEGLDYVREDTATEAGGLADRLKREARDALGGAPDIWHIHNHSLGKNPALPGAVFDLAQWGERLLLHLHDFPEDGRPALYRGLREAAASDTPALYPAAEHVHYAVLNDRDHAFMTAACHDTQRVHDLPNAVWIDTPEEAQDAGDRRKEGRLFLYPTRAIRRKNLGELLLWSAVARPGDRFAATLAPENPEARSIYDAWVRFAGELALPVEFNVGADRRVAFADVMRSADVLMTTSVAEGFGLAYLEPWLLHRPLVGRDLPDVTSAFRREGLDLSALYERLDVPLDWVGRDHLRHEIAGALEQVYTAYGRTPPRDGVERAMDDMVRKDRVDFGRLNEPLQCEIIRRVAGEADGGASLTPLQPDERLPEDETIAANCQAVTRGFGRARYGERLFAIYEALLSSDTSGKVESLSPDALIDRFLAPERLNLLRT